MHVLEIFQPESGGVPAYVEAVVPDVRRAGVRVTVACPPGAAAGERLRRQGVDVIDIDVARSPNPLRDAPVVRKLSSWSVANQVSLIHGHSTKAGLLAALVGARAEVPSLYTPHGWSFEQLVSPPLRVAYALYERHLVRHYHSGVVTVSSAGREAAERWRVVPPGRVEVVTTGLRPQIRPSREAARELLGVGEDTVLTAWVGRIGPPKRAEDLVPIARRLAGSLTVVAVCGGVHGEPLERELRDAGVLLADPGLAPAVAYAAADIFIQTSDWEAAPLAVLEAMDAGLPVVAYDVGDVGRQIQSGRTGYRVRPGDNEMLSECLLSLVRRPDLRSRMAQAAKQRVQTHFTHEAMVRDLLDVYARYANEPAPEQTAWAAAPGRLVA